MDFHLEATKRPTNDVTKIRNISVKSVLNVRLELEMYSALMEIAKSPLCAAILHPSINNRQTISERSTASENVKEKQQQQQQPHPHWFHCNHHFSLCFPLVYNREREPTCNHVLQTCYAIR